MMWTEVLKAVFLPERNPSRWLVILSTRESINEFIRTLKSGDYNTRGINNTLDFLQGGDTSENRIRNSIIDEDEDDVMDNYEGHYLIMIDLLEKKLAAGKKRLNAADLGRTVAQSRKVRTAEEFIKLLDEIVKNPTDEQKQRAEEFLVQHSKWLRQKTKGKLNRSIIRNKYGYDLSGTDFSTKEAKKPVDIHYKNLYTLFNVPTSAGKTSKVDYTANTLTPELAIEFYKLINHTKQIPEPLTPGNADIYQGDKLKVNPYLIIILEEENPFRKLASSTTAEDKVLDWLSRDFEGQDLVDEMQKVAPFIQPRDVVLYAEFIEDLEGGTEEEQKLYHDLSPKEENFFIMGDLDLYSYRGAADISRRLKIAWQAALKTEFWEEFTDEEKKLLSDLLEGTKTYPTVSALIEDNQNIAELIDIENLSTTFSGNPFDLLAVVIELDEALSISDPDLSELMGNLDELSTGVEERLPLIKDKLVELAQEKVEEMVANPREYQLMPRRRKGVVDVRSGTTLFSLLLNKGIIG